MIDIGAGLVVAIAGWHTCWVLGELRDDQELKESGPVVGAGLAGMAAFGMHLAFPPSLVLIEGGQEVLIEWAATRGAHAMILSVLLLVAFEYGVVADRRPHEGLLLGLETGPDADGV